MKNIQFPLNFGEDYDEKLFEYKVIRVWKNCIRNKKRDLAEKINKKYTKYFINKDSILKALYYIMQTNQINNTKMNIYGESLQIKEGFVQIEFNSLKLKIYDKKGILQEVLIFMDVHAILRHILEMTIESESLIENTIAYVLECLRVNRDMGADETQIQRMVYEIIKRAIDDQV